MTTSTISTKIFDLQNKITYFNNSYNQASLLASSLLDGYWADYNIKLSEKAGKVNKALAKLIFINQVNWWLLYNDKTCASKWHCDEFQLDYEKWYVDNDQMGKIWQGIKENNKEHWEYIDNCFLEIAQEIYTDIENILNKEDITYDDLDQLSEQK